MKNACILFAIVATTVSAPADWTRFAWDAGTLTDITGGSVGYATVFTIIDSDTIPDVFSYVSDDQIDYSDLQSFTAYSTDPSTPTFFAPNLLHTGFISGDGSIAGQFAYAIVVAGTYADIASVPTGTFIGITDVSEQIIDLQPTPSELIGTGQFFSPGNVQTNIQIIPEPNTVGLMVFVFSVMAIFRRKMFS